MNLLTQSPGRRARALMHVQKRPTRQRASETGPLRWHNNSIGGGSRLSPDKQLAPRDCEGVEQTQVGSSAAKTGTWRAISRMCWVCHRLSPVSTQPTFIRYPRLDASGKGRDGAWLPTCAGRESANATVEVDKTIANQRHHVEMLGWLMVNEGLCRSTAPGIREGRLTSASGIL